MESRKKSFVINSRKFNGVINRSWQADLINSDESLLTFIGVFDRQIIHPDLGVIRQGTVSFEYYWTNRWYNVFRFHEPDGSFRNFYCNINEPPVLSDDSLNYVDLDVDVLVWKDLSYKVLDLDEFNENSKNFGYPKQIRDKVSESLSELINLIEDKVFPFDYPLATA